MLIDRDRINIIAEELMTPRKQIETLVAALSVRHQHLSAADLIELGVWYSRVRSDREGHPPA
jgi:hypothetical protein